MTAVEPEPDFRQRWDVCDGCGCATVVSRAEGPGLPDPGDWERSYECMVCGGSLTMGNADEITNDDEWRLRSRNATRVARLQTIDEVKRRLQAMSISASVFAQYEVLDRMYQEIAAES